MKKIFFARVLFLGISLGMSTLFTSCNDDSKDGPTKTDKTELNAQISACETLANAATTAFYPQAAIDEFKAIIASVRTIATSESLTQEAANNAVKSLTEARSLFESKAYGAIPETALIIGMTFDEEITNNQFTTSGKALVAKLIAGPTEIFGAAAARPTIVSGKKGNALYFSKGGHLEIPDYNPADLMGKQLSISVWVKPDSTKAGNYIASLNYWNSWKFQLQEQNKPFFTVMTDIGGTDADNQADFSAPNKAWTHIVVSLDLTAKKLNFYINGVSTMEWTVQTKPNLSGSIKSYTSTTGKLPLFIGAATSYAEALVAWEWQGWNTPTSWDHFVGAMDNLHIYNIALTEGQVAKLHNDEK